MSNEPKYEPSFFEWEFQAFVARGGLDETHVVNEDYERSREAILCKHRVVRRDCVVCYRPLKPYFPGDSK